MPWFRLLFVGRNRLVGSHNERRFKEKLLVKMGWMIGNRKTEDTVVSLFVGNSGIYCDQIILWVTEGGSLSHDK